MRTLSPRDTFTWNLKDGAYMVATYFQTGSLVGIFVSSTHNIWIMLVYSLAM